jgi:hypothetical protein
VAGDIAQNAALISYVVNLLQLDDFSLAQYLQGKNFFFIFVASDSWTDKADSSKGP